LIYAEGYYYLTREISVVSDDGRTINRSYEVNWNYEYNGFENPEDAYAYLAERGKVKEEES